MKIVNDCSCNARNFCSCPVEKCPRHPKNQDQGCDPCIQDNLKKGKMPACFFRMIHDNVDQVTDYSIGGFVAHYLEHQKEYKEKFK